MAECDDIILIYRRAVDGDQSARSDLWRELRPHMLRVIRFKAADLNSQWVVEADEIYDVFLVDLFNSKTSRRFDNAYHLTCYIEKSLRRRTARTVCASTNLRCERLTEMFEQEAATDDFVERIIQRDELIAALSKLTPREQAVCTLFGAGCRWCEIGQRLGIASDTARQIFLRATARIRHEVSGKG